MEEQEKREEREGREGREEEEEEEEKEEGGEAGEAGDGGEAGEETLSHRWLELDQEAGLRSTWCLLQASGLFFTSEPSPEWGSSCLHIHSNAENTSGENEQAKGPCALLEIGQNRVARAGHCGEEVSFPPVFLSVWAEIGSAGWWPRTSLWVAFLVVDTLKVCRALS